MLKNKKKKIFVISLIIVLLIVLFGVIDMVIYPKWLTQPVTNISKVHISSEFLDLEITDQKMMSKLYNLCKNTKIKHLEFDTSESNRNMSDCFSIDFMYKNNSSDTIDCKIDATVLKQTPNALFWLRGEANEGLLSLLLEIEKNGSLPIKADQEQTFTETKEYLKKHEQDFNKIVNLAKSDISTQKEEGSGSISLTRNSLLFNNLKLEQECLLLIKKTKISGVSFGQEYVSFIYDSHPKYVIRIIYSYNDDIKEEESLEIIVKKIKPFYYMRCMTLSN